MAFDPEDPKDKELLEKAIAEAAQKAVNDRDNHWKKETEGLVKNRDEILEEKRKLKEAADRELDQLKTTLKAKEHGVDPTKLEELAEEKAKEKAALLAKQFEGKITQTEKDLEKLKSDLERKEALLHETRVRSLIPPGQVIQGAEDYVTRILKDLVEFQKLDDTTEVPRIKVNGTWAPGLDGSGYMTVEELFQLSRQGGGSSEVFARLAKSLAFALVSNAKGSGSVNGIGEPQGKLNWYKMSEQQRSEYIEKHGSEKAKDLIEESEQPK